MARHARSPRRTTAGAAVLALLLTTVLGGLVGTAHAAGGSDAAPVTHDDHVVLRGGSGTGIDVIANDTDADGDKLAICRLGPSHYRVVFASFSQNTIFVDAPRAASGTFTFTYYACDYHYLTPGTLTVTVKPTSRLDVHRILDKPGFISVHNANDAGAVILYGSFRNSAPDGKTRVGPGRTVLIRVHRVQIDWVGVLRRSGADAGHGNVKHIALPPHDPGPPPQPAGKRTWP